jgi:hypothetical protein
LRTAATETVMFGAKASSTGRRMRHCVGDRRFASAQRDALSATLKGRILDAVSGTPLAGATIAATTAGASARTDSAGQYRIDGLTAGIHRFLVSASGYTRGSLTLAFAKREVMERDLELDPIGRVLSAEDSAKAQMLPAVPVTAPMSAGLAEIRPPGTRASTR